MKIAIISTFMGQKTSGAEISSFFLTKGLSKTEDVFIITSKLTAKMPTRAYALDMDKVPNIALMIGTPITNYMIYKKIIKILKKEKPDIIHVQDFPLLPSTIKAAKQLKIPVVMSVRDFRHQCNLAICSADGDFTYNCNKRQYYKCLKETLSEKGGIFSLLTPFVYPIFSSQNKLFKKSINQTDSIVAVSYFVKESLKKSGVDEKKIDTIFVPAPDWPKIESKKRSNTESNTVLFAGGLIVKAKGFQTIVKAMKDVPKDITLRIAGSGIYLNHLKVLRDKLDLKDRIEFLGKISYEDMQKEYLNCDIVLLPSIIPESLSRIIFESFSAKKPIIATDSGGNKELVKNGETGLLIKDKTSAEEFASKITQLRIATKIREEMGENGYRLIQKCCSLDTITKKHLDTYKKTIEQHKK